MPKLPKPEPVVAVPKPPKPAVLVVAVFVLPNEKVAEIVNDSGYPTKTNF